LPRPTALTPDLPRLPRRRRLIVGLGGALAGAALPAAARTEPTVAAASDLKFALDDIATGFERQTGQRLRMVFGSSGQIHAQILQGAPFHLFMSADEEFVFRLAEAGRTRDRGRVYGVGRIGIIVPPGSPLQADGELADLAAALRDGRLRRFAIANPEHAPYGLRAREALQHAGLWPAIERLLVYGENISQTAQFATSGATQGGIIALSLARAPQVVGRGRFALIPERFHRPLVQRMVLLKDAPAAAVAFHDHLASAPAQATMARYGFVMPGA
jgi:molybdate transport system substrate-binding protein